MIRRIRPLDAAVVLGLALLLGLLATVAGCQNGKIDLGADDATRQSLQPRLEQLAEADPELEPTVRDVLDGWAQRPEPDTYDLVEPLIEHYRVLFPGDSDVDRVMRSWRNRVKASK